MSTHTLSGNKIYKWRVRILVLLFFMIIFVGVAYLAQAYFSQSEVITIENKQPINENNSLQKKDNQNKKAFPAIQENEIEKKLTSTPLLPIERNKNPETKMKEAMLYAKPQILSGKYIDVSLGYQNMVIFEDGRPLNAFLISSGMKSLPTPIGTFKIENKYPRAWSKKYGLFMPYWMALAPDGKFGIHELPEWPGGYKEGEKHLGVAVSHGCIRLGVGSAEQVYNWADIGTPVIIHK